MTNEELEQIYNCLDGGFGETSGKLSAHIKALEAENEQLKKELNEAGNRERIFQDSLRKSFCEKQNLRKENAKLKCLALHGMFGYACAKMNVLVEKYKKEFASGTVHKDFSRWHRLSRLWREAYRTAKKELKEKK